ncbi:MBL fold metallo-hydrolase [Pseudomonas sp. CFBP13506]|uniref:MBL fold metallo-hydrolase n=1 Tax=Pseudomonas sp. CFBP13506 TaxID=2184010 RepID=UPI0023B95039|nr:MBL fold metallo-hydrolase [Pseudomonas sp. CFBP13506]
MGDDAWLIIDSCMNAQGRPAPLAYLESIGVPYEHVKLLIASHWHDDHVRGFSEIVEKCENAKVCMGQALTNKEFHVFVSHFNKSHPNDKFTSGTRELHKVLKILESRSARGLIAHPDRRLWQSSATESGGQTIEVWSLSPSDACSERFLKFVTAKMPVKGETKYRAPSIKENETAIAILIKYGDTGVLLGADLEETHQGWTAILGSTGRPELKSSLFKIPHHGSENGHHDEVWKTLLIKNPIGILTPYNKGHKLPKDADLDRIRKLTSTAFTTQVLKKQTKPARSQGVEKMIRSTAKSINPIPKQMGHISAKLCPELLNWDIELNDGATSIHN